MSSFSIRSELSADCARIAALNERVFGRPDEAELVDALREAATPFISLVAVDEGAIVGHIAFSPVTLRPPVNQTVMGLAPMCVCTERQRQGIGSQLVEAGLARCKALGAVAVVVLGHADYYPRFGFEPASRFGVQSEYDVPDPVFMLTELVPGALVRAHRIASYHPVFAALS